MSAPDDDLLLALVRSSVLWRYATGGAAAIVRAASSSGFVRTSARLTGAIRATASADRLQLGAIVIGVAALVYGLAAAMSPASVVSALPRALLVLIVGTAAVIAVSAGALVQAWPQSRLCAMWSGTRSADAQRGTDH